MANFKANEILVCEKTQRYSCGALKLRKGAIVKALDDSTYYDTVRILRYNKENSPYFIIDSDNMRLAVKSEIQMWNSGVFNINNSNEEN